MDLTIVLVAFFSALPPTIAALAAWRESKKIHHEVNNRMSELLELTRQAAMAEGKLQRRFRRADYDSLEDAKARERGSPLPYHMPNMDPDD